MDLQNVVDSFSTAACVVSVEMLPDGHRGKFRIVTGNRAYLDTIERPMNNVQLLTTKFEPNSEYTKYMERDLNFEDSCYRAAVENKIVHAYAHPARFDVWFNMSFLPLRSDIPGIYYCIYMMEINFKPEAKRLSAISPDIASAVLETCIKLRSNTDIESIMSDICEDIRELCDSELFCILLMDESKRSCSVLGEALSDDTDLVAMENFLDDGFYDIAESWKDTIAGSNCLIVKNESDMEVVRERNPVWHDSITKAGGRTIVLFPLEFRNKALGYIWALNFSAEVADTIKETLELTSFILASEIYSYKLMDKLQILSSRDMLTGVMNRNEMNNYVDKLVDIGEERSVGVVFVDLNGLKMVNDSRGHTSGDTLLKNAAAALQEVFDVRDIFRAGGDEFVVILLGVTEEELRKKVDELREASDKYMDLVFAIGQAYESNVGNVRKALHTADENMYLDKKHYYALHPERKRH